MSYPPVSIALPAWVEAWLKGRDRAYADANARMELVIGLSRQNIEHGTGGPFAAGVFDLETGCLVAPGVNLVTSSGCSSAHAEILALSIAQQVVGSHDLRCLDHAGYELVSSAQPCAMCLGAIPWSGVRSLVYGARAEDVEKAGFDEGDKLADWQVGLERRGIRVKGDVCREAAAAVIADYVAKGGPIY